MPRAPGPPVAGYVTPVNLVCGCLITAPPKNGCPCREHGLGHCWRGLHNAGDVSLVDVSSIWRRFEISAQNRVVVLGTFARVFRQSAGAVVSSAAVAHLACAVPRVHLPSRVPARIRAPRRCSAPPPVRVAGLPRCAAVTLPLTWPGFYRPDLGVCARVAPCCWLFWSRLCSGVC